MTAEPARLPEPPHPLSALTTYELARYRRDLERAAEVSPRYGPVAELLRWKLAEALAEQQSRTRIASTSR
jgi:hypothetical protein